MQRNRNSETSGPNDTVPEDIKLRQQAIQSKRKRGNAAQTQQAERMVKRSKRILSPLDVGDNATVSIPQLDRGRSDPRNIIGVVIDCSENEYFTIAVKGGVLSGKYLRNQFDVCATKFYLVEDVVTEKSISLRQAGSAVRVNCGGPGYTRCNCLGAKKCQTNGADVSRKNCNVTLDVIPVFKTTLTLLKHWLQCQVLRKFDMECNVL